MLTCYFISLKHLTMNYNNATMECTSDFFLQYIKKMKHVKLRNLFVSYAPSTGGIA